MQMHWNELRMQELDEKAYWLWLAGVLGPGSEHAGELIDLYGSAREVYEAREREDLSPYLPASAKDRLLATEPADYQATLDYCRAEKIEIITFDDPDYPLAFSRIPDLPLVLYCTGQKEWLNGGRYVSIVGTRRPTQYGVEACRRLGHEMAAAGAIIVSGLADGLDGEGHRAATEENAPTIGILGCPIDQTYPSGNRHLRTRMEQNGCVISEYGPGFKSSGQRFMFLHRNRLIAAMGDALCVMEARLKSGTLNTVGHARRYGKTIFALPGSIFSPMSEGTNQLLADGAARPLLRSADVLAGLGLVEMEKTGEKEEMSLGRDARALFAFIGPEPKALETLCAESKMGVGQVLAALTELEIAGKIIPLAGRRYLLK